ncbi:MAG: uracil-DNA glycosylase [Firmicutes bacterium]|nr:uracil-DNA glycosylase [Bacillota bacterium]
MAEKSWQQLEEWCYSCQRCELCQRRHNVVIDRGSRQAQIMFIGEGPGEQEDLQGKPFVGPAGQLFDKVLVAAGFSPEEVYVANVVKCRPPNNRDPRPEEQKACINFLRYQTALLKPKIIVCLGRIAAKAVIDPDFKITKERGQWIQRKGIWMMATFHPSAVLRDELKKRPLWEDFKSLRIKFDEVC